MSASPFDLHGKVAVVTGASSGIGAEIARALGEAGSQVVLVGRSVDRLADAEKAVIDTGAEAFSVAADLTADDGPASVVAEAVDRFGRIDVLVHSAGIYEQASLADSTDAVIDAQWATNARAPYRLTREALPHLGRGSSVIFLSSTAGHVGSSDDSAYCVSKGAVEMLVKALGVELAPQGIRVNAVAPGNVRTPMNDAYFSDPDNKAAVEAATPAGRVGEVGDIGPAVVYLASSASGWVHGHSLRVDGGETAQ
jgi:NAD(P)-dependent dehydrogenase (short-subunit alcohol dehydrogenase family)